MMALPIGRTTMAMNELLNDDFFRHAWHRHPVQWRRGAATFMAAPGDGSNAGGPSSTGIAVDHAVVDAWVLAATDGDLRGRTLLRAQHGVQFLEGVDAPPVDALVADARLLFETDGVWFDVVRTTGLGSIGSHFDDSDNFVVQLDGVKQWRLADASVVPEPQRSLRYGGDADAASFAVATPTWEATARPGDVVYLPYGWPHHGIARTPSLSISLVVKPAITSAGGPPRRTPAGR